MMELRRFINFFLAIFVTAGLAVAPVVTPSALAKLTGASAMADEMSAMSADMPCCPDKQKSNDCQDCPLVAMCMLKVSQAATPIADKLPIRLPIRVQLGVTNDLIASGLDRPPPDHPPRSLV